jgi:single-strand DNA-binding protein
MINCVVLVGRLGNDPELTYAPSGTAIAKFRIAVNRPPRQGSDQEETDWLNVVTFGRVAETVGQYLDKGSLVGIEGRVQSRTWQRQDGTNAYAVEINAQRVQFLESRQERERRQAASGGPQPQRQQQPPRPQQGPPPPPQGAPPQDIDWAMNEEEDPFGDQ